VFVPMHRRRLTESGQKPCPPAPSVRAAGVLAAVGAVVATGLFKSLFDARSADTGSWIVLGVVIAVAAVGGGLALARAIGRQGKV
jgi:hypothetical protein